MNLNLKPHQLLSHLVPGAFAATIVAIAHFNWSAVKLNQAFSGLSYPMSLVIAVGITMLGEFIDCIRDLLEHPIDKHYKKINWEYLLTPSKSEASLHVFENYYFTYYVFCANSFVAGFVAFALCILDRYLPAPESKALVVLVSMAAIFFLDARALRNELAKSSHTKRGPSNAE